MKLLGVYAGEKLGQNSASIVHCAIAAQIAQSQNQIEDISLYPLPDANEALAKPSAGLNQTGVGASDKTKTYSGYSIVEAETVFVNQDSTVAAQKFSGTAAQFLAVVILHESTHVAYYREGFRNHPDASPAMEEASIRYWVEDWAIRNGMPETVPNGRSGTGFFGNTPPFTPNFSSIYDGVVNDGYSTDPFGGP